MKQLVENRGGSLYFTGDLEVARTLIGSDGLHLEIDVTEDMKTWTARIVDGVEDWCEAHAPTEEDAERGAFGEFVSCINFDNIDDGAGLLARLVGQEG